MEVVKRLSALGKHVLIISDLHVPYHHPDAVRFLATIKKKLLPQHPKNYLIINVGDEADKHDLSRHASLKELDSAGPELEKTRGYFKEIEKVFPVQYICSSNHGSLIFRRAKLEGIPVEYIRTLPDIYGVKRWTWHDAIILKTKKGDVYICHGKSGTYGKLCKEVMMSAVQGHYHGKFELTFHNSPTGERFNMFVGCLIDHKSMAFEYGKNNLPKPILGVGYIMPDGTPKLIKMDLNEKGRWNGKLAAI